jgi:uncharacterized membrane protein YkgB
MKDKLKFITAWMFSIILLFCISNFLVFVIFDLLKDHPYLGSLLAWMVLSIPFLIISMMYEFGKK